MTAKILIFFTKHECQYPTHISITIYQLKKIGGKIQPCCEFLTGYICKRFFSQSRKFLLLNFIFDYFDSNFHL